MVFGYRDEFEYFECGNCGCLQIKEYPNELCKYYPSNYYSFGDAEIKQDNLIFKWAKKRRALYGLGRNSLIGSIITKVKNLPKFYEILRQCNLNLDSKILEIGCGSGFFLKQMQREGFTDLVGIDPYLPGGKVKEEGVPKLLRRDLFEYCSTRGDKFDLVMLHHTLEHMSDQKRVFSELFNLIKVNGFVWITMPVVGYAWRHYAVNWCGLDAPRHLIIHSRKSIRLLCNETSFDIVDITYNSTEYQFLASEQYSKDIALLDSRSYIVNSKNSFFSDRQIEVFRTKAIELNKNQDGDSASFLLRKSKGD